MAIKIKKQAIMMKRILIADVNVKYKDDTKACKWSAEISLVSKPFMQKHKNVFIGQDNTVLAFRDNWNHVYFIKFIVIPN